MKDDMISRQAAIDALGEEPLVWHEDDAGEVAERNQWRRDVTAIKALPSAQPGCEDAVYRKAVQMLLAYFVPEERYAEAVDGLRRLPSAQPGEDIRAMCGECDAWNQYKNYPQPRWTTDVNDILAYLDGVVHPLVSPENWNVYSELYDMVSGLLKPWEGEPNE